LRARFFLTTFSLLFSLTKFENLWNKSMVVFFFFHVIATVFTKQWYYKLSHALPPSYWLWSEVHFVESVVVAKRFFEFERPHRSLCRSRTYFSSNLQGLRGHMSLTFCHPKTCVFDRRHPKTSKDNHLRGNIKGLQKKKRLIMSAVLQVLTVGVDLCHPHPVGRKEDRGARILTTQTGQLHN
jgi:hypothetical protein